VIRGNVINGGTTGGLLTGGDQNGLTIDGNTLSGSGNVPLAYVNGTASVSLASSGVNFTGNTFTGSGSAGLLLGTEAGTSTITGNTFRGGGRGSWINQPTNFVLSGNVFVNNTTKNEPDMSRGRIAFQTAKPGQFPELYFTIYEPGASYGPVIVRDNHFILGESAPDEAVTFAPNGHDLLFTGNTFQTKPVSIVVDPSCINALIDNNSGAKTVSKPVDFNHGRR
jgi:hypothetical protein